MIDPCPVSGSKCLSCSGTCGMQESENREALEKFFRKDKNGKGDKKSTDGKDGKKKLLSRSSCRHLPGCKPRTLRPTTGASEPPPASQALRVGRASLTRMRTYVRGARG
jgi:hypothetical protein